MPFLLLLFYLWPGLLIDKNQCSENCRPSECVCVSRINSSLNCFVRPDLTRQKTTTSNDRFMLFQPKKRVSCQVDRKRAALSPRQVAHSQPPIEGAFMDVSFANQPTDVCLSFSRLLFSVHTGRSSCRTDRPIRRTPTLTSTTGTYPTDDSVEIFIKFYSGRCIAGNNFVLNIFERSPQLESIT